MEETYRRTKPSQTSIYLISLKQRVVFFAQFSWKRVDASNEERTKKKEKENKRNEEILRGENDIDFVFLTLLTNSLWYKGNNLIIH